MTFILLLVAVITSIVGSICGIGGGVLIKPILDATGIMSVSAISFLSGCTVLAMALSSVGKNIYEKNTQINKKTTPALGVGAAFGGLIGKAFFDYIKSSAGNDSVVGLVQALVLGAVVLATLIYTVHKSKIKTRHVTRLLPSLAIGLALGVTSSFLGVGGGPINIAVLSFFYSSETKEATTNSLCIILFSQTASLIQSLTMGNLPELETSYLVFMIAGGVIGGLIGQKINKKIEAGHVEKLFKLVMIVVICVCVYNAARFATGI